MMMAKIPPAVPWDPVVTAFVARDRKFARGLLEEAVQALLGDEVPLARNLIRHVINGTIGYRELSRRTGAPEKSLIRMFGPRGSPTAVNLFAVLAELQRHAGVQLTVNATPVARKRPRTALRRAA
jgi:hypothetical protein